MNLTASTVARIATVDAVSFMKDIRPLAILME